MLVQKGVGYRRVNLPAARLEVWLCRISSRLAQQHVSFRGVFAAGVETVSALLMLEEC